MAKIMYDNATFRVLNVGEPPWSNQGDLTNYTIVDVGDAPIPSPWYDYLYQNGQFVFSLHSPTISEQDDAAAAQSKIDYRNLPNWATWTATEAETNITAAIFNGQDAAAVKANIAAQLTDVTTANVAQINARLAVIRTLFGTAVDAIIVVRGILSAMGKALVYLRNVAIRRQ